MDVYNTTPINANAHHSVGVTFPESTASGSSSDVNIQCKTNDNKSNGSPKIFVSVSTSPSPPISTSSLSLAVRVLNIERELSDQLSQLTLNPPVAYVYNPLSYAWETHSHFVTKYATSPKQILFVGMNPGPWGMVQTGVNILYSILSIFQSYILSICIKVPFGEVRLVQDWLGIIGNVGCPPVEHPQRRVQGFQCPRTEVSGQRFWGFFRDICGTPENLFKNCFVYSYCPLSFMHSSARNITPPELKVSRLKSSSVNETGQEFNQMKFFMC